MFVSEDKKARKEAFKMIKDSKIMEKYPGFELGHIPLTAEFENLEFLAAGDESLGYSDTSSIEEPPDIFWTQSSRLEGRRLCFYTKLGSDETPRMATAGGVITYRGRPMLLTVNHFLEPTQTTATPSFVSSSDEDEDSGDECEITGLSDFDDEDEDRLIEITSQGSITPEFETSDVDSSRSGNNEGSVLSSGITTDVQNNTIVLQERLERLGQSQASKPLDANPAVPERKLFESLQGKLKWKHARIKTRYPIPQVPKLSFKSGSAGSVTYR
ncbi:hypothetical protein NW755_011629 [Fusarium falciforme]|uniref:Uncharacterized protein n=1 Tax=Fusarium falciforme TaxID=195108 RepID=A0A9W8QZ84_9HYPO|nr:hypothetical protein NW755_011629 [Fusarium falciforme]